MTSAATLTLHLLAPQSKFAVLAPLLTDVRKGQVQRVSRHPRVPGVQGGGGRRGEE